MLAMGSICRLFAAQMVHTEPEELTDSETSAMARVTRAYLETRQVNHLADPPLPS